MAVSSSFWSIIRAGVFPNYVSPGRDTSLNLFAEVLSLNTNRIQCRIEFVTPQSLLFSIKFSEAVELRPQSITAVQGTVTIAPTMVGQELVLVRLSDSVPPPPPFPLFITVR